MACVKDPDYVKCQIGILSRRQDRNFQYGKNQKLALGENRSFISRCDVRFPRFVLTAAWKIHRGHPTNFAASLRVECLSSEFVVIFFFTMSFCHGSAVLVRFDFKSFSIGEMWKSSILWNLWSRAIKVKKKLLLIEYEIYQWWKGFILSWQEASRS